MTLRDIVNDLLAEHLNLCYNNRQFINSEAIRILEIADENMTTKDIDDLVSLVSIGNITYNYTANIILPIEDGIYDMLVVKLKRIDFSKFTPGAPPLQFDEVELNRYANKAASIEMKKPFIMMSAEDRKFEENMLYPEIIQNRVKLTSDIGLIKPFSIHVGSSLSKRLRNTAHNYPDLVGTLHKCKIVLDKDAIDLGIYDQPNTTIFERDFLADLVQRGIINTRDVYDMVMTLKYDGVSVEADVTDQVISARTRGDTDNNEASDITPILAGYRFPKAPKLDKPIGMKFEAIVRYDDLYRLNEVSGNNYINGRTAIIGIMGSSDAWKYRDYITLVPLQCDASNIGLEFDDRIQEINFLNTYYSTKEYIRATLISGNYATLLFSIRKYVQEAEFARTYIPFMYDGVVAEFLDNNIRKTLGRENNINQYAMAIKFEALKKQTTFRGYFYTVGQDGSITPMAKYDPVEFIGSIHTKSTLSSLERFNTLDLRIGDIINVTYVNDVMPYVTKTYIDANIPNHQRPKTLEEEFPTKCPFCGSKIKISSSGASAYCSNIDCPGRTTSRMSNMLAKMGVKNFSAAAIDSLQVSHFKDLYELSLDQLSILGPTKAIKFKAELDKLINNPIPDYRLIGSLGFTSIAAKTWKVLFDKISLEDLHSIYTSGDHKSLDVMLTNIKGIGPITAKTIVQEYEYFYNDIQFIIENRMYIPTVAKDKPDIQIRFTGFRDRQLEAVLNGIPGIDCDGDTGVTKSTGILLVPMNGYNQGSKCAKAIKYGVPIVPVKDFLEDPSKFIPEIGNVNLD